MSKNDSVKKYLRFGVQSEVKYSGTSLPRLTKSLCMGEEEQVNGACDAVCTTTVSKLPFCGTLS